MNPFTARSSSLLALCAALCLTGCDEKSKKAPSTKRETSPPSHQAPTKPSGRTLLPLWRSLLKEAARAELRMGGLVMDFGTPEQHKYTRGGWASGWDIADVADSDYAIVDGPKARLGAVLLEPCHEIVLRARASAGVESVVVRANGTELGRFEASSEWATARVAVREPLSGRVSLELVRRGDEGELQVDWLKLAAERDQPASRPIARVVPLELGGRVRRGLAAPTSRTYSFYLHVPDKSKLIVDTGSDAPVDFEIRAFDVQEHNYRLFAHRSEGTGWREHVVDLAPVAGRAVRLDFTTHGEMVAAGWGEPAIHVEEVSTHALTDKKTKAAKNVVMVVLDTTRHDAFLPFSPDNEIKTPIMDKLVERGVSFLNAYDNENWTKPSVATMLSGLYPDTHTARRAKSELPDEVRLLSEELQDGGFTTAAFTANAVVSDKFGFNRGWDEFHNLSDGKEGNGYYLYRRAAEWLDDHAGKDVPFFLFVQSVDPHTTYEVPSEYSGLYFEGRYRGKIGDAFDRPEQSEVDRYAMRISDRDLEWIRALYWGEVTYQDEQLGVLVDKLDELGVLDETLFVVTNDHGEELREHGHMGHGWTLYDEMIKAPLILMYPGLFAPGAQVRQVVEHVDLAPTLLDILGREPIAEAEGTSLLPLLAGQPTSRPALAISASRNGMRSIRVGHWKLIVGDSKGWLRLYNLDEDPLEENNQVGSSALAGRLCEIYLGEALGTPDKHARLQKMRRVRKIPARDAEIDAKTRRKLESLGYL